MKNENECKNPWLCSVLGFFLPLVGLIIGAIIGKGTGVKHALGGIALRWVLVVGFVAAVAGAARENAERVPEDPPPPAGWEYSTERSPIDDTVSHYLRRESVELVRGAIRSGRAVLMIRRKEGKREVFISWPGYIASGSIPVTVRFDGDDAVTEDWGCATDGRAVFSPYPFADFWGMVRDSRRLVVRLTPRGKSPETVTFDLSSLPQSALRAFGK